MIKLISNSLKQIGRDLFHRAFKQKIYPYFQDKNGLEVGGPSKIFSKELPLYRIAKNIDGCNFSTSTVWEGIIAEGLNYNYCPGKTGYQYIGEASDLQGVASNKYDFLLASHCLEHCANPLKTVEEWLRVIKPGGCILMILPDKRHTFDHKRPTTSFAHLLADYNNSIDEKDLTHISEIFAFHDRKMDKGAGSEDEFRERSFNNYENRCMHHHVFDFALLENIYTFFNIEMLATQFIRPYHQIIAGIKR
jgi:SAM-dependent methyltransferase